MGYVRRKRRFKLTFEDPELEGLEVLAQSTATGDIVHLLDLAEMSPQSLKGAEVKKQVEELFRLFMDNVREWNLEEEENGVRTAVPCTYEGLMTQDLDFVLSLALAWMDGVVSISGPLDRKSGGGKPLEEASIPMAIL